MPTDWSDSGETRFDRRTVLKSLGATGAVGAGLGSARADHTDPNPGDVAPWIRGSTRQVMVKDAAAQSTITLYGPDGSQVTQATADDFGSYVFREVTPGEGYRVSQTVDGAESPRSETVRVFSVDYTPPQELYDRQTLDDTTLDDAGFGYFEVRDGTKLALQVQVPGDDFEGGPYPVLVMYSGYAPSTNLLLPPNLVNALGYALVGVNKRGTQCSGGKFDLWERLQWLDGYDMVETIAAQEWADGVGLVGASYPGYSQFYVAATQPPSLDAISPGHPVGDLYRDVGWPGGALNDTFATRWAANRDSETKPYTDDGGFGDVDERVDTDPVCHENHKLRLQNNSTVGRLRNTAYAEGFYESRSPWSFVDQIEVPTLLAASWQDEQVGSRSTRLLERFSEETEVRFIGLNGDHTAYLAALEDLIQFFELYVAEAAPGDQSHEEALAEYESSDPVKIYWELDQDDSPRFSTTYAEWPPGETWELYCQPDGTLAPDPPAASNSTSTYEYEAPDTERQRLDRDNGRLQWEHRPEDTAVSFVSERLAQDHVCVGSGLVDLWLRSTADDTDLQVNLSEIRPGGDEIHVQEGWLRASHRAEDPDQNKPRRPYHTHRLADREPLPDGEFARLRVELFPFGHVFRETSRVKVSVSNPGGNRDLWAFDVVEETATNEIAHSETMPTKVELPLVPGESAKLDQRPACGAVRNQPCRPVDLPTLAEGPPRPLNDDGLYHDVRGDGEVTLTDVQTLYENLDNPALQDNAWAYNFSGVDPGEVSILDVQALFNDMQNGLDQ